VRLREKGRVIQARASSARDALCQNATLMLDTHAMHAPPGGHDAVHTDHRLTF
jgi:hypothetical protein